MIRPESQPPPVETAKTAETARWRLELPRQREFFLDRRPRVMGVLNITPDSFSDGGRHLTPAAAIDRGLQMLEEGADLLDLGAESTRPGGGIYAGGAVTVPPDEELERLLPVLEGLRAATDAPLSVDTRKGNVARQALRSGADLINDVGGLRDPELIAAVAESGCPVVIMHSRGELAQMQRGICFENVVQEVCAELELAAAAGEAGGIDRAQMILDPGIGFGKTWKQNLELLRHLDVLSATGLPTLVGASRKSFIAKVHAASPQQRLGGSLAAAAWAARHGASIVRAHDVSDTVQFLAVWQAVQASGQTQR